MKRGIVFVTLLLMVFSMVSYGKKLATLPGLFKPNPMAVDDDRLYICDGIEVRIYSLKDFSLKTKFGKAGDGPQEFRPIPGAPSLMVYPHTDYLLISSIAKASFYSKEGKFIKEWKTTNMIPGNYQPIGNKFAGMGMSMGDNQSMAITINFYDQEFKKIKEIYKQNIMKRGSLTFPAANPTFFARENKIVAPGGEEFVINILDAGGNKVTSITREYKRLRVDEGYKKGVQKFLKSMAGDRYEIVKRMLTFTDIFPAIQFIYVDNGKIYIQTYLKKDGSDEFFIYDLNGKFLKRLFVPVNYLNPAMPAPIGVKNDTLYQLVENEDEEEWELHAVELK